jgi:RNA polymerase sigma-70 factor (ECF subfamily)
MIRGPWLLESVYRKHFKAVWRLLRRLGVAQAQLDDAAQDVFLVVQKKLSELSPDAALQSWIFAIAVRVASEYRRRSFWRRAEPYDDSVEPERARQHQDAATSHPEQATEVREAVRLLHRLLAELDAKKREVFVLAELEQLSAPEIASVLDVNLNTVYSRLRGAKQQFDAALLRERAINQRRERV